MPPTPPRLASALAATLATSLTLGLAACGGSGSSDDDSSVSQDSHSASYAASSVSTTAEASAALDASVIAAEALVSSQSATLAARNARASAMAVQPLATLTGTVDCAGGGQASVTANAPNVTTLYNGVLDVGEVYTLGFTQCQSSSGAPKLNGSLTLTVLAPTDSGRRLQLDASALTVALPSSSVRFDGSLIYTSSDAYPDGSQPDYRVRYSTVTANGLTLVGTRNGRSSTLSVSSLLLTGQTAWKGSTWQNSSSTFSCAFTATTPNGSFSATLASTGSTSADANGKPVSGLWSLTLPNALVALTLSNGSGALTIDNGKNGSIDRTIPVTVDALLALI